MKKYRPVWFGLALAAVVAVFTSGPLGSQSNWYYLPGDYNDGLWVDRPARIDTLTARHQLFPPSYSTLPTCDTDTEPAILFDTSDNLLKSCSDLSGSFQWNPIGGDVDQDGYIGLGPNAIDPDDNNALVPGAYRTQTTYSGNDARVNDGGTMRFVVSTTPRSTQVAFLFMACIQKGDVALASWTTTTGSSALRARLSGFSVEDLGEWVDDPTTATSDIWGTFTSTNYVDSFTCYGFSG